MTIEPLLRTRTGLTGARLPLLRTFTLLSATLLLAANAYAEPSATIQEIKRRGLLVVAMVADSHYPFFYEDETGQLRGADVDLAEGIANALGVELVLSRERTTFDGVVD